MRDFVNNIIASLKEHPEIWELKERSAYVQREKMGISVPDYSMYLSWTIYWLDLHVVHPFYVRLEWEEKKAIWKALNEARVKRANLLSINKKADDSTKDEGTGDSDTAS